MLFHNLSGVTLPLINGKNSAVDESLSVTEVVIVDIVILASRDRLRLLYAPNYQRQVNNDRHDTISGGNIGVVEEVFRFRKEETGETGSPVEHDGGIT